MSDSLTMGNIPPFRIAGGSVTVWPAANNALLEKRVTKLEQGASGMKEDLAVVKSNYATKEDIASVRTELHQAIAAQTKWLAATMIGVASSAIAISKLIF